VRQAESLKSGLTLAIDGQPLALRTVSRQAIFPPGAGGLPTMKMGFIYQATLPDTLGAAPRSLHYQDNNFPDRAGWKEIVALARPGTGLMRSTVPEQDRSLGLTNYPTDMLHSAPQVLQADLAFRAAPPGANSGDESMRSAANAGWLAIGSVAGPSGVSLAANRQGTPRSAFTDLIKSNRVDLAFLFTAALIAAVLGGFHALEPGHGKTLVAAYLVGSHGKAGHAVLLGTIVTATHTISVYALGLITLYASEWILPERLYPWLGMASGSLVAGLGFTLFIRRYLATEAHADDGHDYADSQQHSPDHSHHHAEAEAAAQPHRHNWWGGHVRHIDTHLDGDLPAHEHDHGEGHEHSHGDEHGITHAAHALSLGGLFALGITGGIVPCPAALVVLLGALAFHRVAFGLFLIVAFSAGLAAVLISLGLAMVYAGRFMSRFGAPGPLTERWLPLASSAVITIVGVTLTLQSLAIAGVFHIGT
jgi:ABC-type nickel/cobalt efflux system permease component RcnA